MTREERASAIVEGCAATWDFPDSGPRPAVILGTDERVSRKPKVNVLLCSSHRAARKPELFEVLLDQSDGLDWETVCKCDLLYAAPASQIEEKRGTVGLARRREIAIRIIRGVGLAGCEAVRKAVGSRAGRRIAPNFSKCHALRVAETSASHSSAAAGRLAELAVQGGRLRFWEVFLDRFDAVAAFAEGGNPQGSGFGAAESGHDGGVGVNGGGADFDFVFARGLA